MTFATRRLRPRIDRRPAGRLGVGHRRGAVRDQGAGAVRQQGAAAHGRAGRGRDRAQQELGPECAAGQQAGGADQARRPLRPAARCRRALRPRRRPPPRRLPRQPGTAAPPHAAPVAAAKPTPTPPPPARRAPAKSTKPGADPFTYFVQVGAYGKPEDAEQQRARIGLMGMSAKVSEREQSGRTMYRVRLGPVRPQGRCRRRSGTFVRQRRRSGAGAGRALNGLI